MDEFVLTVSQVNSYVEDKLYSDTLLSDLSIQGELTGVNLKYSNAFFSLKDENCLIECMIPDAFSVSHLEDLQEGETIIARGNISLYKKSGKYRFLVRSFTIGGLGEIYRRLAELKEKLSHLGVFDPARKKTLPKYPSHIGIVTSAMGAALQDMIHIAQRRNPAVKLSVYASKVQGETAKNEIAAGIEFFNQANNVDIIIIARGGGSQEDLSAFNEEKVVMSVFRSNLPVVSAVGHETDFTLCDFAADLRAPTPSAAAELCIPDRQEILNTIDALSGNMRLLILSKIDSHRQMLAMLRRSVSSSLIESNLQAKSREISFIRQQFYDIVIKKITGLQNSLSEKKNSIALLDPEEAFKRGFALVKHNGQALVTTKQLATGDAIEVYLKDGSLTAKVTEKRSRI